MDCLTPRRLPPTVSKMSTGAAVNPSYLSAENAKVILSDLISAFNASENVAKLDEARDTAGNDMLKVMQYVFPVAAEIQMDIIKNYGFSRDGRGTIQFALAVKALEKEDSEVASLSAKLRSYFIPSMIQSQQQQRPLGQSNSADPQTLQ